MLTASGTATVIGGVCLQFIIGSVFHWRYVAAVSAIIPFLACNAVFLIPESPYWLYARNRIDDAHKSLQWLRGWVTFETVKDEFQMIMYAVEDDKAQQKQRKLEQNGIGGRLAPFKQRGFILPFLLIMFGFVSGHFSGMTPLQTYALQILQSYKVPINEYYATILLGAAQVLGCILGMVLVRSLGKRHIAFLSLIGCGACFFAVATYSAMYMEPVRQFDNTVRSQPLDNLEHNVIDALATIRNDIAKQQNSQAVGDNVTSNTNDNGHSKYIEIGAYTISTRNFSHVKPTVLYHVLNLGLQLCATNNATDIDQVRLKEYLIMSDLPPQKTLMPNDASSSNASNNATINSDGMDLMRRHELLRLIEKILLPWMTYAYNESDAKVLIAEIRRAVATVADISCEQNELCVENGINAISEALVEYLQQHKSIGGKSGIESKQEFRWLPMILLLAGTFFAHSGAKLFPWMLMGEVSRAIYIYLRHSNSNGVLLCFSIHPSLRFIQWIVGVLQLV